MAQPGETVLVVVIICYGELWTTSFLWFILEIRRQKTINNKSGFSRFLLVQTWVFLISQVNYLGLFCNVALSLSALYNFPNDKD